MAITGTIPNVKSLSIVPKPSILLVPTLTVIQSVSANLISPGSTTPVGSIALMWLSLYQTMEFTHVTVSLDSYGMGLPPNACSFLTVLV